MSIDAMRWAKKVKTGKSSSKAILTWLADMCGADLCAYPQPAASRVVQQIQSAHAEWRRRNGLDGDGDSVAVMAGDGGNLLEPLDAEEWGRTHGPVDSSDRFDD